MEVEINWRRLILISFLAAMLIVAAYAVPRMLSTRESNAALSTSTPSSPSEQKVAASEVTIHFDNQSAWKLNGVEACLPKLQAWIGEQYPLQKLAVVITDTVSPDMVIGVRQTGGDEPDAIVRGKYEETEDGLILTIAVVEGEPGDNLDVALTVETALLAQEYARPKTKAAWKNQQNGLDRFRPLISKEEDQWTSRCLHLAR